ncbi:MAG TPA: outer membrane lipid asymmetry maintenance protein MlaD [Rhizomicrobium sp.]|jgi:phospholipid/cholesterol/gamma-HCH transport system substrate-binding protein|nr:outer membrane lipid asymmetry maintenance protein MlaD [Rhizomicrobium sp.]
MTNNTVETIMGAIVVAVAAVFIYFAYTNTSSGSLGGYELQAIMPRVDGLATGTDVRLSGIKIGAVSGLTLNPKNYLVTLHMDIRNDIQIPDDSSLMVTSSGLLGGSYLSITPGGSDAMLKPGGRITNVQGSVDLMGLVGRFIGGGNNGGQQGGGQPKPAAPAGPPPASKATVPNAHP